MNETGDFLEIVQLLFEQTESLDEIFRTGKALRNIIDDMERNEILFRGIERNTTGPRRIRYQKQLYIKQVGV